MPQIKIANRAIGSGQPPFIVAEVGINHNGDLDTAFKLIRLAKEAGADAVKFQTFTSSEMVGDPNLMFTYRSQGKEVTESMLEMFKRHEFSKDQWRQIKRFCTEEGVLFFSTPQNRTDLDLLLELGVPAIKVGSDDFINLPLLKDYATTKLPLIVSCGMSDLAEAYQALNTIGALDGYPTILLLCTSQYPTPPQDVNLLKLQTLTQAFPMVPMGFSDHTQGELASSLAVAMGACFFEKHFTLSHDMPGPDHWFSEDPAGLKTWIQSIRKAHTMMGSSVVRATGDENAVKRVARRSIMALRDIQAGEALTLQNIGLRRPGTGLPPSLIEQVVGLKAQHKIPNGTLLKLGDFS
jgi:N,N'-diacetyllegionaminate synthase